MIQLTDAHSSVLARYNKAIVHMRKQVETKRFGLIFGAGLSRSFNIPTWKNLVDELAQDSEINGKCVIDVIPPRAGLPYLTEMLFEHYKRCRYDSAEKRHHNTRKLDYRIGADWRELIRKHLYANIDGDISSSLEKHPYLTAYLPLIRRTHMTVTYNFDDLLEQALQHEPAAPQTSRGFESVTNPWMQFRRTDAVIYHPNGVIPQNLLETPSDRFVFSEASYVKQLMGIFAGDQAGLVNHLSKHTCLLVGLSLEDDTLRNVLTQAAHSCPGNFHYYIHYLSPSETLDEQTQNAIVCANFKVYNLITLFLDDDGIRSIGELIDIDRCTTDTFCDFAETQNIPVRFRFYITGAMGVGKSTTINQFRNLTVLDEWLEQRLDVLAKGWDKLTSDEKEQIDSWITDQFAKKNAILRNAREGIFVLDRGPLDPVSFTHNKEWEKKASLLLEKICPGQARWRVEDGRVIFLRGDGSELSLRMVMTKRTDYTAKKLNQIQTKLSEIYGTEGVTQFDTHGLTPSDVARRIAEVIHLETYFPTCDLHGRLETIKNGELNVKDQK